jgi:hypothetical protein
MTTEHQASRTLVKSPPELWAECSDAESLVRHLGEFGDIKITRLEPETTVAWEGEHGTGTVEIEPSGWGTRVTLKVQTKDGIAPSEDGPVTELVAEPDPVDEAGSLEEARSREEATHAKVEETPAEPDPAVAADPGPARGWKRVIALTRTWFRSKIAAIDVEEPPPVAVEEAPPVAVGEAPVEREVAHHEPELATPVPEVPEATTASIDPDAVLSAALDSLGQAHHRPYSRA